jgi:hypothetical protein
MKCGYRTKNTCDIWDSFYCADEGTLPQQLKAPSTAKGDISEDVQAKLRPFTVFNV